MTTYHTNMKEWKAKKAEVLREIERRKKAAREAKIKAAEDARHAVEIERLRSTNASTSRVVEKKPTLNSALEDTAGEPEVRKRSADVDKLPSEPKDTAAEKKAKAVEEDLKVKVKALENELDLNAVGNYDQYSGVGSSGHAVHAQTLVEDQFPLIEDPIIPPEPIKPLTHKEFVAKRIKNEHLPPGIVTLNDKRYLLR